MWEGPGGSDNGISNGGDDGGDEESYKVECEHVTNLGQKLSFLNKCKIDQRGLHQRETV